MTFGGGTVVCAARVGIESALFALCSKAFDERTEIIVFFGGGLFVKGGEIFLVDELVVLAEDLVDGALYFAGILKTLVGIFGQQSKDQGFEFGGEIAHPSSERFGFSL